MSGNGCFKTESRTDPSSFAKFHWDFTVTDPTASPGEMEWMNDCE